MVACAHTATGTTHKKQRRRKMFFMVIDIEVLLILENGRSRPARTD
jgi:hypothetical protein